MIEPMCRTIDRFGSTWFNRFIFAHCSRKVEPSIVFNLDDEWWQMIIQSSQREGLTEKSFVFLLADVFLSL
jgi:hypothetical protein